MTNIRRHTTVILLALAALILAPLAAPVVADSPEVLQGTHPAIGTKVRVSPTTELTLLAVEDNKYTWNAKIEPRTTLDSGAKIDTMWHYDGKAWVAGANLFDATVTGRTVTVSHNGETKTWTPTVTLTDKLLFILPDDKALSPTDATLLAIDPWNENYFGNTLQWQYGNGITRNVRLIEGLIQEYYTVDKPLDVDLVITANLAESKGYTWTRPLVAWDANHETVELVTEGDYTVRLRTDTKAEYPITIDPDSSFVTSADDGKLYWQEESSYAAIWGADVAEFVSASGTGFEVGQERGTFGKYTIHRGFLYFDTSSISSEAIITGANLFVYISADWSEEDFNLTIQSGMPTYPHISLQLTDYNQTHYSGDYGNFSSADFAVGFIDIPLTADGLSLINATSYTKFALRNDKEIAGIAPTQDIAQLVGIYSYEQGSGYWPYLNVTYIASAVPTVTTLPASSIANSTARLNGYINSSGGELCDVRFEYGTSTGNYTTATAWVNDTYDTGAYPYVDLDNLTGGATYYYRIQAGNTQGITSGTELNFTTESSVLQPTAFSATASGTTVSLTWTLGLGASRTLIRSKVGSYPSSITDGTLVYLDSGNSKQHTGLLRGTTYYYTAWGESGGYYSENTTSALVTTGAFAISSDSVSPEYPTPDDPTTPETWWLSTDIDKLAQLPLYSEVNGLIDDYGVTQSTGWTFLIISVVLILSAGVFAATTGNVIVTGLAFATLCTGLSLLRLLPMLIMGLGLIIFVSIGIMRERA